MTTSGDAKYSDYESGTVSPGSDTDGYDVKTTGSFFSTVTTSYKTHVKNTHEFLEITLYLNTNDANPIKLPANSQFEIDGLPVTNIFIDTPAGYDNLVEVLIFG